MSQTCPYAGKFFRPRCRIEARYDYEGPTSTLQEVIWTQISASNADKEKLIEKRQYVKDVCTKCGLSIPR